jgi:L-fuculose-phosphate aldolase
VTLALRERLVATARRMSDLGLTPGLSGNASVRTAAGFLITPSALPFPELRGDDLVELRADGSARADQRTPSSEWQLHRDLLAARPEIEAVVHTHSLYCTSIACLRRSIPAIHYMVALAGGDHIPCADYATYGSAELAASVVAALGRGDACLMANHGMVALGRSLDAALRLAAEVETLAGQYWHASAIGTPHVLPPDELARVRGKFATHGQRKKR